MTDRDWEAASRTRLERNAAHVVTRLRGVADRMEAEARGIGANGQYVRGAAQMVRELTWGVANLNLSTLFDAAQDAQDARTEKLTATATVERTSTTAEADKMAGAVKALAAMREMAKGWAEGAAQNEIDLGRRDRKPTDEQEFVLADILTMINDAARKVGVEGAIRS
jgi:hypothetical protein